MILQFLPFLKAGLDWLVQRQIVKQERLKRFYEMLDNYQKSGTPVQSKQAYDKIQEAMDAKKKKETQG
jgi:hypothetical protein